MNKDTEHRMTSHGVRPTAVRSLVLSTLDRAERPISSLDIETKLDTVDRSTITRTLAIFVEKGLIHIIDDGSGSAKYESCRSHSHSHSCGETGGLSLGKHDDLHVHFRCTVCGRTECLPSSPIPHVTLPDGYTPVSANYIITGTCADCSGAQKH